MHPPVLGQIINGSGRRDCILGIGINASSFATLWTVAHQAPLSMGFPRQEYWSGLPFPPPGDLSEPGMESASLVLPAPAGGFFTTVPNEIDEPCLS